jgi:ATP-dependent helicase HrpA
LVETDRLRARAVAAVSPKWAEELGAHLVTRSYSEPVWDARRGVAMAAETVTLWGLVLASGKMVAYGRVDREIAREMFIRHALVERDWASRHRFLERNERTLQRLKELETRTRRRARLDADGLFDFYADRIPAEVISGRHFDRWWSRLRQNDPECLNISDQVLADLGMDPAATPDAIVQGDLRLELVYRHDSGSPLDGISLHIPIGVLNQVSAVGMDWLVPAYRDELMATIIRSLPKSVRKELGPMAEVIQGVQEHLRLHGPDLTKPVVRWVCDQIGVDHGCVDHSAIIEQLPAHLRMKYVVVGPHKQVLDAGGDVSALMSRQTDALRAALIAATGFTELHGLDSWAVGTLAEQVWGQNQEIAYPTLVDEGRSVGLTLMATPRTHRTSHRGGLRRLLLGSVAPSRKALLARVSASDQLAVAGSGFTLRDLAIDASIAAVDRVLDDHGLVRTESAYQELENAVRAKGPQIAADIFSAGIAIASMAGAIAERCEAMTAESLQTTAQDAQAHLRRLVGPGFIVTVGSRRIPDLGRYVAGIEYRLTRLSGQIEKDHHRIAQVAPFESRYRSAVRAVGRSAAMEELGWMLEELRLATFAQQLVVRSADQPRVSPTRVDRLLSAWGF